MAESQDIDCNTEFQFLKSLYLLLLAGGLLGVSVLVAVFHAAEADSWFYLSCRLMKTRRYD